MKTKKQQQQKELSEITFIKINQKGKAQQKSYKIVKEFLPKKNNKRWDEYRRIKDKNIR